MPRTPPRLIFLALVSTLILFGCSSDPSTPAGTPTDSRIQGKIGRADFEINVGAASGYGRNLDGPFVLRGQNARYVDSLSALVVDLTVTNKGHHAFPEPVVLTFVHLIPDSVTVLNPDNGIHGDGAAIDFSFANNDSLWTQGEESLPRTVEFGAPSGVSVGFSARLTVGNPAAMGSISGRVWNDANQDGIMDVGEQGIEGVRVHLATFSTANAGIVGDDDNGDDDHDGDNGGDDDDDDNDNGGDHHSNTVLTDADGHFVFGNLPAGSYVVTKVPTESSGVTPTTPLQVYVLLTETNGVVGNFTDANFGCVPATP